MPSGKFYEGLEAVVYVALHSGARQVSSREICESQGLHPRHLEPVMQLLVSRDILKGTKGPKGGYSLAKEKRKITAGDIYRVFSAASGDKKPKETDIGKRVVSPLRKEVKHVLLEYLDGRTLEDICGDLVKGKAGNFNI